MDSKFKKMAFSSNTSLGINPSKNQIVNELIERLQSAKRKKFNRFFLGVNPNKESFLRESVNKVSSREEFKGWTSNVVIMDSIVYVEFSKDKSHLIRTKGSVAVFCGKKHSR